MTLARLIVVALRGVLVAALTLLCAPLAAQQDAAKEPASAEQIDSEIPTAAVEIDGDVLFRVRGITAYPAEARAAAVANRIAALFRDPEFDPGTLQTVEGDGRTSIVAGTRPVIALIDADGRMEGVSRQVLASVYVTRIRTAAETYRTLRTPEYLRNASVNAAMATAFAILAIAVLLWTFRRIRALLERRLAALVRTVAIQSFQIMRAERIMGAAQGVLGTLRVLAILSVVFLYLDYVLNQFPWTRAAAKRLVDYVVVPLRTIGGGALEQLPDLAFLVILFFVVRYLLKIVRMFFQAVEGGHVKLTGFDAEWAQSTYKLVRVLIVVFGLVVAYPYIPGSGSDAFKGISIFIGVVFSLGSSSAISNLIAGYMMTYRRAFKVGDRVRIGSFTGDVTERRLQATHLKTVKNEEIIVPNSMILTCEVVNYSTLARSEGVIVHTTVGIGYETPWRQVEAMLLEAAQRTRGAKTDPPPFVRQQALGDFCITYELNVYCGDPQAMGPLHTELNRNTLDVFNEYGVQIMTPAYEGDPPQPKVVPRDEWFAAPARPELVKAAAAS